MSFYAWLKRFRDDQNAIGDLARDAIADRCFPGPTKGPDRLDRYELHLTERHDASSAAIDVLHGAWAAYERELARQRTYASDATSRGGRDGAREVTRDDRSPGP
jgi:uncharacterized protein YozE (UPF0346 family)